MWWVSPGFTDRGGSAELEDGEDFDEEQSGRALGQESDRSKSRKDDDPGLGDRACW